MSLLHVLPLKTRTSASACRVVVFLAAGEVDPLPCHFSEDFPKPTQRDGWGQQNTEYKRIGMETARIRPEVVWFSAFL